MMLLESHSCPACRRLYAVHLFALRSGIGTPEFDCGSCGNTFTSSCCEWRQMSSFRKLWYVAVSLVYTVCVGAFLGSLLHFLSAMIARARNDVFTIGDMPWLGVGMYVGWAGVIGFQILRVVLSIRRSNEENPRRLVASRWSPHTNAQGFVLGMLALVGVIGMAIV